MGVPVRTLNSTSTEPPHRMRRRKPRQGDGYFKALLRACGEGIAVIDVEGRIVDETAAFQRLLGGATLAGRGILDALHPDDARRAAVDLNTAAKQANGAGPVAWRLRRGDGKILHAEVTLHNLLSEPDVQGLVLNLRDITQTRALMQRLKHDAFRDAYVVNHAHIRVQTSVGIAVTHSTAAHGAEELLRDADVAMYVAKERGKGRYEF